MNNNVKSAATAGLLGIFLGAVGAHDWYLGNTKKGIIHVCLAASGIIVSVIANVVLPSALSYRALLSWGALVSILGLISAALMAGNGIWGLVEGIIILSQGDAGLARKGYNVAQPNMNYGYNNFGGQPMNNMNGNMNGMNNGMNGNMNNGGMNGNMNNANMNMNGNGNDVNNTNNMNNGGNQNGQ